MSRLFDVLPWPRVSRRCRRWITVVFALFLSPSAAWAYRPFVSTDAVADPHEVEIELGYFNLERTKDENTFRNPTERFEGPMRSKPPMRRLLNRKYKPRPCVPVATRLAAESAASRSRKWILPRRGTLHLSAGCSENQSTASAYRR